MKQVVCKATQALDPFLHLEKLVVFALVSYLVSSSSSCWDLLRHLSEDKSSCGVVAKCAKTAESCNSQWHHQITSGWSLANQ